MSHVTGTTYSVASSSVDSAAWWSVPVRFRSASCRITPSRLTVALLNGSATPDKAVLAGIFPASD
jgi:hypothetical protein